MLPLKQRFLDEFSHRIREDDLGCDAEKAAEMADSVWKIIEDATSYGFNSSHAVCVALDSLYGAYAKSHFPLEFYVTLLKTYSAKGDKARITLARQEMKRGFGIEMAPCRFRQDNRDYFIDHKQNTISDALGSVKHVGRGVANALFQWKDREYTCFTDLLYDMEMHSAFDSTSEEILIRMGYFSEFGTTGKLLALMHEFRSGESRFSKTLIRTSQERRLNGLREIERRLPEAEVSIEEQMRFEIDHYGAPLTTYPEERGKYSVVEVDDRYSPKLTLYNLQSGNTGIMKIKKADFLKDPLQPGDVIKLTGWQKRPAYGFVDGKAVPKADTRELWIKSFEKATTA